MEMAALHSVPVRLGNVINITMPIIDYWLLII